MNTPLLHKTHTRAGTKKKIKTRSELSRSIGAERMGKRGTSIFLLVLVVCCYGVMMAAAEEGRGEEEWGERRGVEGKGEGSEWFLPQESKSVVKTDAGDLRVVRGFGGRILDRPMHIGFLTMEPHTLFVPQYLDTSLIIFIRQGEARIGLIYKDELGERRLQAGDIYRIPAGSAFYLVNPNEGQRLHAICSIDPSESLGLSLFRPFFIGGGTYPTSVLAGFEPRTLATAFNVTVDEVQELMSIQTQGPIMFIGGGSHPPSKNVWNKFLQLKEQERLQHLKRMMGFQQEATQQEGEGEGEEEGAERTWSWRKLLKGVFGELEENKKGRRAGKSPDSYNIYKSRPDFKNNYGWSMALDDDDYEPLKHSGIGVYLVNLTAGAMMAPHVNPTATEYGIVLRGSGRIQIVYPNGTLAMDARVSEGDVFWIPRYFAFCQIASRSGPFEFFGFTTSSRKNRPQFLAGSNSLLHHLNGPELAAAFGVSEERIRSFIDAQNEVVILPTPTAAPPDDLHKRSPKLIKNFGTEMVMGFD